MGVGRVIVVVGPPNAGKGTQVGLLAKRLGAVHFSAGDLIRRENDPRIMAIHDRGELIASEDIQRLVGAAIKAVPLEQPVVFDGAKKLAEAEWLMDFLPQLGRRLNRVVSLVLDENEARRRSEARDGGRADDAAEVQGERWRLYRRDVTPAIDLYRRHNLLVEVDAAGTREQVAERVWRALERG